VQGVVGSNPAYPTIFPKIGRLEIEPGNFRLYRRGRNDLTDR